MPFGTSQTAIEHPEQHLFYNLRTQSGRAHSFFLHKLVYLRCMQGSLIDSPKNASRLWSTGFLLFLQKAYDSIPAKRCLFCICFAFPTLKLIAQDIHYTQFYADPVFLNSANTGYYKGAYRLGANYKAQWPFASSNGIGTYNSYGAFADFAAFEKKLNKLDWMGMGAHFSGDAAGDGKLAIQRLHFSLAYHKGLDRMNRFMISAGFGLGLVQRSIDFEALYFNNQWTGEGFDQSVSNFEPFRMPRQFYPDLEAGICFRMGLAEKHHLSLGSSLKHINRPKDTFYNSRNRLGIRPLINLQYDWNCTELSRLMLAMYFSDDKKAKELTMAALYAFRLGDRRSSSSLDFGLHYRLADALAPMIGYEIRQTRILLSYDINLSGLSAASRSNGGPEISIIHVGARKKPAENKVHCPIF